MSSVAGLRVSRDWWPELAIGATTVVLGAAALTSNFSWLERSSLSAWVVTLGYAAAATLFRHAPGVALLLVWVSSALLVLSMEQLLEVQLVVALVAYGCTRYGEPTVVWLSGLSIPGGALLVMLVIQDRGFMAVESLYRPIPPFYDGGPVGPVTVLAAGLALLAVPWLLGMLVRSQAQTAATRVGRDEAEAGLAQAQEIAALRAEQTRLANDVHDVVGHSLAVILAQAESAQFLPDDDTERIRKTLENVATSARQSLHDVRSVLAGDDTTVGSTTGDLDSLLDGLATAGNDIRSTVFGTARPLPPELDLVAYRVLQEMLTNALKHGLRSEPVTVERHWEGELRIEVRNAVDPTPQPGDDSPVDRSGTGVNGMRRRVESVGGHLDVRRRDDDTGSTFTATAWVPVRTVSP